MILDVIHFLEQRRGIWAQTDALEFVGAQRMDQQIGQRRIIKAVLGQQEFRRIVVGQFIYRYEIQRFPGSLGRGRHDEVPGHISAPTGLIPDLQRERIGCRFERHGNIGGGRIPQRQVPRFFKPGQEPFRPEHAVVVQVFAGRGNRNHRCVTVSPGYPPQGDGLRNTKQAKYQKTSRHKDNNNTECPGQGSPRIRALSAFQQ